MVALTKRSDLYQLCKNALKNYMKDAGLNPEQYRMTTEHFVGNVLQIISSHMDAIDDGVVRLQGLYSATKTECKEAYLCANAAKLYTIGFEADPNHSSPDAPMRFTGSDARVHNITKGDYESALRDKLICVGCEAIFNHLHIPIPETALIKTR